MTTGVRLDMVVCFSKLGSLVVLQGYADLASFVCGLALGAGWLVSCVDAFGRR